jgi:predicted peptidase
MALLGLFLLTVLPANEPPKTGHFTLTFSERSPISSAAEIRKRLGYGAAKKDANEDYEVDRESFEAYVPAKYDGKKAFGLLVFISPGINGGVKNFDKNGGWTKALDAREIIWIGPNNAGNVRIAVPRIALALDAVHNGPKKFNIDPQRVYIGGVSGGGRITSTTLLAFPEAFTGGYSIIGADYFRQLPSKSKGGVYAATFKAPPSKTLALAKKRRFVFLTGDDDANREQMEAIHQSLKKAGWKNTHYFQVPNMGHTAPDGEWFAKGLAVLDGDK